MNFQMYYMYMYGYFISQAAGSSDKTVPSIKEPYPFRKARYRLERNIKSKQTLEIASPTQLITPAQLEFIPLETTDGKCRAYMYSILQCVHCNHNSIHEFIIMPFIFQFQSSSHFNEVQEYCLFAKLQIIRVVLLIFNSWKL